MKIVFHGDDGRSLMCEIGLDTTIHDGKEPVLPWSNEDERFDTITRCLRGMGFTLTPVKK